MEYISLYKKYVNPTFDFEKEYQGLFQSVSTIHFDFHIKGHPAFININKEVLEKVENIYLLNNQVVNRVKINRDVPISVENAILNHSLVEEIHMTNAMEGVASTRKEITKILGEEPPQKYKRLYGMTNKYQEITQMTSFKEILDSQELRDLYDKIILKDIENEDPKNCPDGKLFRKEGVDVTSNGRVIHSGITPEEEIIKLMNKALDILNDEELGGLLRIALFHYLFGYIHPFYDGNGRMNRFISSYYLSQYLDKLCALQLSIACKKYQKQYYEAFKVTNDVRNRGDLTFYVLSFLEIIEFGLKDFIDSTWEQIDFYIYYKKQIDNLKLKESYVVDILQVLLQNNCFDLERLTVKEIVKKTKLSKDTIKKRLKLLENKQYIQVDKSAKEYRYIINIESLD